MKSRSHEIGCLEQRIALKFDRRLGSTILERSGSSKHKSHSLKTRCRDVSSYVPSARPPSQRARFRLDIGPKFGRKHKWLKHPYCFVNLFHCFKLIGERNFRTPERLQFRWVVVPSKFSVYVPLVPDSYRPGVLSGTKRINMAQGERYLSPTRKYSVSPFFGTVIWWRVVRAQPEAGRDFSPN